MHFCAFVILYPKWILNQTRYCLCAFEPVMVTCVWLSQNHHQQQNLFSALFIMSIRLHSVFILSVRRLEAPRETVYCAEEFLWGRKMAAKCRRWDFMSCLKDFHLPECNNRKWLVINDNSSYLMNARSITCPGSSFEQQILMFTMH